MAQSDPGFKIRPRALFYAYGFAFAFAHRRKTLVGSLALSRPMSAPERERLREALIGLGHPPDVRAERLSPEEFRTLARLLAR